jgi:hypothetical protein
MVPNSSRREKRSPVTIQHMHCLALHLVSSNPKDAAVLATSAGGFWGACRFALSQPTCVCPSSLTFCMTDSGNWYRQVTTVMTPTYMSRMM